VGRNTGLPHCKGEAAGVLRLVPRRLTGTGRRLSRQFGLDAVHSRACRWRTS